MTSQSSTGTTSHNTLFLKTLIPQGKQHYQSTQMSGSLLNKPLLYGLGRGTISSISLLMTLPRIRLFYLLLSNIKYGGLPFTLIIEWKRCFAYLGSSDSFGQFFIVTMVELDYKYMICFLLPCFELEFEPKFLYFS